MTVIVAVEHEGDVYLGADSVAASGWDKTARRDPKAFLLGDAVIGFTSSYRMGQIIRFHMDGPQAEDGEDEFEALGRRWIPKLREALAKHGYTKIENTREEGGQFIVGWRGRVFSVESDFQIREHADGFGAVGCGSPYALGALHAAGIDDPEQRILVALEAAARFSNGVGAPFVVIETPKRAQLQEVGSVG
jgi:ATP-dependent protease HslVU (ClpYQ) peptidase subunit